MAMPFYIYIQKVNIYGYFTTCVYVKRNSRVDSSNDEEGDERKTGLEW